MRLLRSTAILSALLLASCVDCPCVCYGQAQAQADRGLEPQYLAQLEEEADHASLRDQVMLYGNLADRYSLLAAQAISNGSIDDAQQALAHLETCTVKLQHSAAANSRSLKKTELLLHTTHRRLTDVWRSASEDMKPQVQSVLRDLNSAQTALLSSIFAK